MGLRAMTWHYVGFQSILISIAHLIFTHPEKQAKKTRLS